MRPAVLFTMGIILLSQSTLAQNTNIASKADAFLTLLDDTLNAKALYSFEDEERYNWHFVPRERNGLSFNDMNDKQRAAALALLKASLSEQGYQKASNIMALENILREVENRPADDKYRD